MAILTDPLFSDEARGQVAKTLVFKRAQVHPVICAYSYHKINWTPSKINQAIAWKILCNAWRALSETDQNLWRDSAPGVLTGFNYFMQCKSVFPLPPCYVIPDSASLFFDFIIHGYPPPAGGALVFDWEPCI